MKGRCGRDGWWRVPHPSSQLIGGIQRRYQRFGGHGEGSSLLASPPSWARVTGSTACAARPCETAVGFAAVER
jgi:hypothetical protein